MYVFSTLHGASHTFADFSAIKLFYRGTDGRIGILDPQNLSLDTKIILLAELVTEI